MAIRLTVQALLLQPESPLRARQRKTGLIFGAVTSCSLALFALLTGPRPGPMVYFALASIAVGNAAVVYIGWREADGFPLRERRRRGGRNGVPYSRAMDRAAWPAPAGGPPVLRAVARLMPPSAGRRWLAEAEGLLFELAPERRGRTVRNYLLSAPRLVVIMWASRLSRQARPRSRRPR
jgi:hypothetical protein